MSEHIQSAPGPHAPPAVAPAGTHMHTPGVAYENERFDFRLILWVGVGLVATAVVIHIAVWWLLGGLEKGNAVPAGSVSELVLEDASKPLGQRIDKVPTPHLEGIERGGSLIVIRTETEDEARFYGSPDLRIQIGENEKANLFELRQGQRVTLTYYRPGGADGALGVVTAVTSPPPGKADQKKPESELPDATRTINGTILRIEAHSIAAARKWAEAQIDHYGWIDRDKGIVHIPIEKAMDKFGDSGKLGTTDKQKKNAGRLTLPGRSNSGRAAAGGKR